MTSPGAHSTLIIGTGSIGERHLRCFQGLQRGVVAGCEPNEALRTRIKDLYGCNVFASLDEAFAARSWTGAVISTPAHTHIPIAWQCIERNVNVLIEKPLATSVEGLDGFSVEVAKRGLVVRVAYVHRSMTTVIRAKEILREGRIGDVKHVVATGGQHFPSFRPAYASTYFARRETGGGIIQDAMTHVVHAVEWLVGPFVSVFCDATHQALEGVEVEDTANLVGRLRGDIPASLVQNQFQAPNELLITIHGLKGSVRADFHHQRVGVCLHGTGEWEWFALPSEERDGMFIRQADSFLNALEGKPDDLATLEDGWQTLKVNLAAMRSSDRREEVTI